MRKILCKFFSRRVVYDQVNTRTGVATVQELTKKKKRYRRYVKSDFGFDLKRGRPLSSDSTYASESGKKINENSKTFMNKLRTVLPRKSTSRRGHRSPAIIVRRWGNSNNCKTL